MIIPNCTHTYTHAHTPQGLKCDIEALYADGGFEGLHRTLARRVLQQQYL